MYLPACLPPYLLHLPLATPLSYLGVGRPPRWGTWRALARKGQLREMLVLLLVPSARLLRPPSSSPPGRAMDEDIDEGLTASTRCRWR